ncbi:hypothetical protein Patl1_09874 [Pistacia atlantica]|uniref:Uncharacterized protein n=1 Tax=Pistacia atlantica TaxID=434234 RepID=A0ACC1A596_9ROSI|nr:hypothetical protein Patl1_09874 [Pistacia atlantica]
MTIDSCKSTDNSGPEKEPEGDKEEEEEKNKGKTPEEDKVDKIYPRDLNIIGGNDPRQWKPLDKRSTDPAELIKVSWLQGIPLFLMAKIGQRGNSKYHLIEPLEQATPGAQFYIPKPEHKQFIVQIPPGKKGESGEEDLWFGLYECWNSKWKGGLRIHYATVEEVSVSN